MEVSVTEDGNLLIIPSNNAERLMLKPFWNNGLKLANSVHRDGIITSLLISPLKDNQKIIVKNVKI